MRDKLHRKKLFGKFSEFPFVSKIVELMELRKTI